MAARLTWPTEPLGSPPRNERELLTTQSLPTVHGGAMQCWRARPVVVVQQKNNGDIA